MWGAPTRLRPPSFSTPQANPQRSSSDNPHRFSARMLSSPEALLRSARVIVQWYTSDTTLYSQPLAKTDSEFLDSDSDYADFDPKPLSDIQPDEFLSADSEFYRTQRSVRPPPCRPFLLCCPAAPAGTPRSASTLLGPLRSVRQCFRATTAALCTSTAWENRRPRPAPARASSRHPPHPPLSWLFRRSSATST